MPGKNYNNIIKAYNELKEAGKLPIRIYEQCLLPAEDRLSDFLSQGYNTGYGDEWFKLGPLKLLVDGSLGARTAYLKKPYADDPNTSGIAVFTQDELNKLVCKAHKNGMQLAIHGIGDKAMYMIFESFDEANKLEPINDKRCGIIHCQITDEELLDKFEKYSSIAYIQPIFISYDMHIVEKRIGKERMKWAYNWKTLLDSGVNVAMGSDCPVEPFDVLPNIYCAVTQKDLSGFPDGGWMSEQKLGVMEALYGFTMAGAYASFEENIKGSISPGKLADMTVLSDNILKISPDKIKDIKILMTFVDGKLSYSAV